MDLSACSTMADSSKAPAASAHFLGGKPVGRPLPDWKPLAVPTIPKSGIKGRTVTLEPLDVDKHADSLWDACCLDPATQNKDPNGGHGMWTYVPAGPFDSRADFDKDIAKKAASDAYQFAAAVIVSEGVRKAVGYASLMRIFPERGTCEIGWVVFSPLLQRTTASTETIFLLMRHAFSMGYRRVEWKCDALNAPSKRAALRFGFSFEGVFRQHLVYKGRNRDTAWLSILDSEWQVAHKAFVGWLAPSNFDGDGNQLRNLKSFFDAARTNDATQTTAAGNKDAEQVQPR